MLHFSRINIVVSMDHKGISQPCSCHSITFIPPNFLSPSMKLKPKPQKNGYLSDYSASSSSKLL